MRTSTPDAHVICSRKAPTTTSGGVEGRGSWAGLTFLVEGSKSA